MPLYHLHPPLPKDESLYHQKAPTEVTIEQLLELRKLPKYTVQQRILHIIMFIIFGIPKALLALTFALITVPFFVLGCAIWRTLGRPMNGRKFLIKFWAIIARIFLFFLGYLKVNFHGQYNPEARFITPNHTCFFDGWLFLGFGPRALAKKEITQQLIFKDVADVYQGISVDRSKSTGVSKIILESAKNPDEPVILIFPEGASTSGDYMFRFHLGAFLSDLPVQPTTIRYTLYGTTRALSNVSSFHHNWYQMIVFLGIPGMKIDIEFLQPVSIKNIKNQDPKAFADEVSLRIANHLGVRLISLSSNAIYKKD
ncbi:Acyltransferase family protein [Histomonas meleagridis]|uniref:Acyltransferase family protein n=1 Tax=Histomonas meleagridis TaxID=135588 RepID=UPI00355ACC6F|nr:Acyltransferase family protein [Histomonas meleagridis]KAH0803509.1 Acyltransferase family protein [Histomonas meleagridis]